MDGGYGQGRELDREEIEPWRWSTADLAGELVGWCRRSAAGECRWLAVLAEFDRREGWRADGALSGVDWLAWRCAMSARTARDKLRVAYELGRRPLVAAAFAAGDLSYCKVRAITRVTGAGDDCDRALLDLAGRGTVGDLERAVRHWRHLADQERGVDERYDRRRLSAATTYDGMVVLEAVLDAADGAEVLAALDARVGGSREPHPAGRRRADALVDLARGGLPAAGRYTLNLVADLDALAGRVGGRAEVLGCDGPVAVEALRRVACDCGVVRHLLRGRSRTLDVGRRTPVWTTAQRRAVVVRDRGRCRFVACRRRTCDIHHVRHFADGGPTSVDNAMLACPRHHTALHEGGFSVTGDPDGTLVFHRPDGTLLGSTTAGPLELCA